LVKQDGLTHNSDNEKVRKAIFENRKTKLYLGWGRKNISTGLEGF